MAKEKTLADVVERSVTVEELIEYAGQFNEEIRAYNPPECEYLRGQIDLIIDAAGLPMDDATREDVRVAIVAAADKFYGHDDRPDPREKNE